MHVIETCEMGVVNHDTIFNFTETEDLVHADYAGEKIKKGFLVGQKKNDQLVFSYCQLQVDGQLDNGESTCRVTRGENEKIRLMEHFEWKSRPGEKGVNVFEEL